MIFVHEILRKFDINSLYTFPPHLYTVATLPWEIKKSFFNKNHQNWLMFEKAI